MKSIEFFEIERKIGIEAMTKAFETFAESLVYDMVNPYVFVERIYIDSEPDHSYIEYIIKVQTDSSVNDFVIFEVFASNSLPNLIVSSGLKYSKQILNVINSAYRNWKIDQLNLK